MCIQLEFLDFLQSSFTKAFLLITTLLLNVVWQEIKNTSKGKTECITLTSPLTFCQYFDQYMSYFQSHFDPSVVVLPLAHVLTVFENYSKCRISILAFSNMFCPIKTDLSGKTVWPQASGFQKVDKLTIFGIFNQLLSTQNVNVARFVRNVESDFFGDFKHCVSITSVVNCNFL